MRIDLNLASHPPPPRAAYVATVAVVVIPAALFVLAAAVLMPARGRLAEERAALGRLEQAAPLPRTAAKELEAVAAIAEARGEDWTGLMAALERTLPGDVRVERVEWRAPALSLRVVSESDGALRQAEAALARIRPTTPVSQSWRDGQLMAEFRLEEGP